MRDALPGVLVGLLVLGGVGLGCTAVPNPLLAGQETGTGTGDSTGDGDGDGDGNPTTGDGDPDPTGGLFLPVDNDSVGMSDCDPFAQDCPDGDKCVPYASSGGTWDANKCVALQGNGSPGDTCTSTGAVEATDTCDSSSLCWDVMEADGQLIGVCTDFCTGDVNNPQCGPNTNCVIANSGSINLCIVTCDPLLQDCAQGLACFFAVSHFACIFTTQDIPLGEPCGFINDCVAGTGCLDAETMPNCTGSACCGSFCDLSDPYCPLAPTECAAFFEEGMAPPGYEDVGVCVIPGA